MTRKKDIKVSYQIFTEEELFNIVLVPKDFTLVFGEWHTPWYVLSSSMENPLYFRSISSETQFHTSSSLFADALRYEDHFLGSAKNNLASNASC